MCGTEQSTLLENLTDEALCDEIIDHFPLFDEILRQIELCKLSQIQRNPLQIFSNSAGLEPLSTAAGETNFKRKQPLKKDCVCV